MSDRQSGNVELTDYRKVSFPADRFKNVKTDLTLEWSQQEDITGGRLEVSEEVSFADLFDKFEYIDNSTTFRPDGLKNNTTY